MAYVKSHNITAGLAPAYCVSRGHVLDYGVAPPCHLSARTADISTPLRNIQLLNVDDILGLVFAYSANHAAVCDVDTLDQPHVGQRLDERMDGGHGCVSPSNVRARLLRLQTSSRSSTSNASTQ